MLHSLKLNKTMMTSCKNTFIFVALMSISLLSYSQKNKNDDKNKLPSNELDAQYTPKGNGPLTGGSSKSGIGSSNYSNRNYDYPLHTVKMNMAFIARSVIALNYEYSLSENISMVGGIGFNYNRDPIFSVFGSALTFNNSKPNSVDLYSMYESSTHRSMSPYFCVAPKFVFSTWGDNYSYIQLDYSRYTNNLTYSMDNIYTGGGSNVATFTGSPNYKVGFNLFGVRYGFQFNTESNPITTHEFYTSVGIRTIGYTPVVYTQSSTPINGYYPQVYSISTVKETRQSFFFGFGYIFGIGWGARK